MKIQTKPIIIAGNGPSLAQIDYSRLPQDFDVFRCNQFYFEDKYFLGKKIKGVFFNHRLMQDFYYTMQVLQQNNEYIIEDLYAPLTAFFSKKKADLEYFRKLKAKYPRVIDFYPFLKSDDEIFRMIQHYFLKENIFLNMSTYMLIVAIAQGYKKIYLTGIDFYRGGMLDYAFEMKNKPNLFQKVPSFLSEASNTCHNKKFDIEILKIIKSMQDIHICSISPSSPISEFFPLADGSGSSELRFDLIKKPTDFTKDLLICPNAIDEEKPETMRQFKFVKILAKRIKNYFNYIMGKRKE